MLGYVKKIQMLKIIDNNHYHVWTDALHARALAHEADNRWDRGTYVRWVVVTAWIALEIACQDALEDPSISYRFRQKIDKAIESKNLPCLDWKSGIWKQVSQLQQKRKDCVHRFSKERDLFPEAYVADNTIKIIRQAIVEIYFHVGKKAPPWIKDNTDQGWAKKGGLGLFANAYSVPSGLDEHAPDTIKVTYTYKDNECIREVLPAGTDPSPHVEKLIATIGLPISSVKVYKGNNLIKEFPFLMDNIRGT